MALIQWLDRFATGVPSIDYEHRQLIDLISALHDRIESNDDASVVAFLAELHAAISSHFALEERIMRNTGYREYPEHKAEHERLLDDIRAFMEAHRGGLYRDAPQVLASRLTDWFSDHFRTMDVRLHAARQGRY